MSAPARAHPSELMADISDNETSFDASAYSAAGHLSIGIKATQGEDGTQPPYAGWVNAAHAARLSVMHYHFADGSNPEEEAQHFAQTAGARFRRGVDRYALDLEGDALARLGSDAQGWLDAFERRFEQLTRGYKLIGYIPEFAPLLLASGKYWRPAYVAHQPSGFKRAVHGGQLWDWQYTDGEISPSGGPTAAAGIGHCDMSVMAPPLVALLRHSLGR